MSELRNSINVLDEGDDYHENIDPKELNIASSKDVDDFRVVSGEEMGDMEMEYEDPLNRKMSENTMTSDLLGLRANN